METHAVVAHWDDGMLTVYQSTQGTAGVRDDLAEILQLPKERVRVLAEHVGGGFGSKFGAGSYGVLAAHLSRKSGWPVRLVLDRVEEHASAGNRPSSRQRLKIGARRDGTLTAIELDAVGSAGVGTGAGVSYIAERMYACPNFTGGQSDVFINAGPGAAFRAPGVPQGAFALEQGIDELAERLGLDPLALRDRIDVRDDAAAAAHRVERRVGAQRVGWEKRHAPGADPGPVKRGVGVAQSMWPHLVFPRSSCEVSIGRTGEVELRSSVQDIGTGTRTVLAQVVAEELGLRPDQIRVRIGDTGFPEGPSSGGSNATGSITPVARNASFDAGRSLRAAAAKRLGVDPGRLAFRDGAIVDLDGGRKMSFLEAAKLLDRRGVTVRAQRTENYGYGGQGWRGAMGGVQFAEVAVDVETGVIRVERIVAAHDCGRPINPMAVESQINGGIQHGISYALLEERILDRATGRMVNPTLDSYKIAGSREVPRIEIVLLEEYHGRSSTDARGIGEPANIATAAAIANAFYNATGVRLRELPMNPPRVLAALSAARRS
jgi:xanthine dehydrogenase YagR molybdenum-binding subunit